MEEVLGISDRIAVMRGRITKFDRPQFSEEAVMHLATMPQDKPMKKNSNLVLLIVLCVIAAIVNPTSL